MMVKKQQIGLLPRTQLTTVARTPSAARTRPAAELTDPTLHMPQRGGLSHPPSQTRPRSMRSQNRPSSSSRPPPTPPPSTTTTPSAGAAAPSMPTRAPRGRDGGESLCAGRPPAPLSCSSSHWFCLALVALQTGWACIWRDVPCVGQRPGPRRALLRRALPPARPATPAPARFK